MFDLRQLRYFVAVAEELSFTRAARRLNLSQPPLSQQVRALEDDLQVRLLDRTRRRVSLTEPGRLFLGEARKILAQAEAARLVATGAAAGYSGRLRLAYPSSLSFHPALPKSLLRFSKAAPGVQLELSEMYTEEQYDALLAGRIDAGFVRALPKSRQLDSELHIEVLDHEPLLLALPSTHALAGRKRLYLREVAGEDFVTQPRAFSTTMHDTLARLATHGDFHPPIRQEAQQMTSLLALVSAGIGLALVPASLAAVHLAGVSLVALADEGATLLLAIACRTGDRSAVLERFLDTLDRPAVAVA